MMKEEMFKLEQLFRSVFKMMKQDINEILGKEISSGELSVIRFINEKGAMKASDLSKLMEVSASHITSVTDSLVEKELIIRERSLEDRRVVELALTTKGEEVLSRLDQKKSEYFQKLFQSFEKEEIAHFIKLFEKLLENKL